jgi:hypothetical protein
MITRPMIERLHVTPLDEPKIGASKPWIEIMTQETAVYKGFRIEPIIRFLPSVIS